MIQYTDVCHVSICTDIDSHAAAASRPFIIQCNLCHMSCKLKNDNAMIYEKTISRYLNDIHEFLTDLKM